MEDNVSRLSEEINRLKEAINSLMASQVLCPYDGVPMTPRFIDNGHGGYKLCYRDNKGHCICPCQEC